MIRIGIVGCGNIGDRHVDQLQTIDPHGVITAVVDIDEEKAKAAAAHFEGVKFATDYRDIYDDVDAVLLSLPHHLHHPIGMDFIKAGKQVLMEKPLANTEEQCLELIETAEKAGIVLMTAYCMRYHPMVVKLKELMDSKIYGDAFNVSLWTEQYTNFGDDSWGSKKDTLGGGQLFSHGCHYIDILLWYLGHPIEGTHVGTNYGTPWMEMEGTSHVSIKFESGAVGYHAGTWGARGTRLGYSFHVHCTKAMLEANFNMGKLTVISVEPNSGHKEEVIFECAPLNKYLANEMLHFIDCIQADKKPITDARSSLQSLRVIWKLYDAEQRGVVADLRGLGLDAR